MKSRTLTCITAMTLFAALAIPVRLGAQEHSGTPEEKAEHTRYKLIDIGTLGGPASYGSAQGSDLILNNREMVTGYADTSTPDPYAPKCSQADCFVAHGFRWKNGVLTDIGALPGVNSSNVSGINSRGWIVGYSENGAIDPLTDYPAADAVLWKDDQIINLGTLGDMRVMQLTSITGVK